MNFFAAFAIMMAMGNMNVNAKVGARHNEFNNNRGRVEVRYDGHHHDVNGHKMSQHERRMMEKRRREEERRRMEEARRREEMRRMEAHRHHAHHRDVVVVDNNVAAGVAVGVAVAALVNVLVN